MTKLDRLIKCLCPAGVEWKTLGEVAIIKNGKSYKGFEEGDIPVYGSGGIMTYIDTFAYDKPTVLIPRKGSIDKLYYVDEPFWNVDTIFYTVIDETIIKAKFLFYYLETQQLERLNIAGGVPSLTQAVLKLIKIPIPPLPVQEEIVHILDNFTKLTADLEADLEAELEARQKQFEYYRDQLLTFGDEVKWRTLGEIGELIRGSGLQKSDFKKDGFPCIHYGQIHTYYKTSADETISFVSPDQAKKLKKAEKGDVLIVGVSENIEDICKPLAWLGGTICISGDMFAFRHNQNTKYITYLLQTSDFYRYKERYAHGAKVTRLRQEKLLAYKVPIPPLAEQERIVSILDQFDSLINDISIGLPAEIEARQKQYAYYRNKLMSFKNLDAKEA